MFVNKKTKGRVESVFHFHLWQCGKSEPTNQTNAQTIEWHKKAKKTKQAVASVNFFFCWPEVSEFYFTLNSDFNSQTSSKTQSKP